MPFTIILALLALLGLAILFGVAYKLGGLKAAIVTTGIAFVLFTIAYAAFIFVVVNSMS